MMKLNSIHIGIGIIAATSLLLTACQKSPVGTGLQDDKGEIVFQVGSADGELIGAETKAEYQTSTIDKVTVYGKAGNSGAFSNDRELITINRPTSGTIWKPVPDQIWHDDVNYLFHAFAHTPVSGTGAIKVTNNGKNVEITQPSAYEFADQANRISNTIDYLLSYSVTYEPSQHHQVVPLVMEHALSKVTLYVTRDQAMKTIEIKNLTISFKNIMNKCSLTCNKQKDINKEYETHNEWSYRFDTKSVANYSITLNTKKDTDKYVPVNADPAKPFMSFIAIPNDHQGIKNYILELTYTIKYNNKEKSYSHVYNLWDYTDNWESGHNITYTLDINSGITTLKGNIKDWIKVDYIEGTILPPVSGGETL